MMLKRLDVVDRKFGKTMENVRSCRPLRVDKVISVKLKFKIFVSAKESYFTKYLYAACEICTPIVSSKMFSNSHFLHERVFRILLFSDRTHFPDTFYIFLLKQVYSIEANRVRKKA